MNKLYSGGMAEVFLARPSKPNANGRILVIKRILRDIANDPVFIKMFRSEIRVTLGFNHPHTIQLHDFGEIDFQPYIAMEYIEGKSLREIMQKFGDKNEPIPVPTVLGLVAQAASGLSYAHHFENTATGEVVNAVHRDISPHNLIVSYDGNLKVIDFGIAKAKNGLTEKTRAGQIKGKCGYLSPEQLSEEALDGRSDVFSLGIVAWEMLTGQKLFQKTGDSEHQIIKRIEQCEVHCVPPSTINPEIPPQVDQVILKALAKDVDERYASAAAFQVALRQVMQRLYPDYTYSDTAQIMHALFETDILLERMQLRDSNDEAQQILAAEFDAKTRVVEKTPGKTGFFGSVFGRKETKHLPDLVEMRVSNLEATLKQKATLKHFALATFYVLSIIGIKLDERYSLLDRFFLPAEADLIAMNAHQSIQQREQYLDDVRATRVSVSEQTQEEDMEATPAESLSAEPPPREPQIDRGTQPVPSTRVRTAMPDAKASQDRTIRRTVAPTRAVRSLAKARAKTPAKAKAPVKRASAARVREPKFQVKPATRAPSRAIASEATSTSKTPKKKR